MKKTLFGVLILTSLSSLTSIASEGKKDVIKILSGDVIASTYHEKGIIANISGEPAKHMYLRGLEINGISDKYFSEDGDYNVTYVKYAGITCSQQNFDKIRIIPGESVSYKCELVVRPEEI